MNRDTVIALAREAGMPYMYQTGEVANLGLVERFAELVAAHEREACAKVCEGEGERIDASWMSCAAAIRSRA